MNTEMQMLSFVIRLGTVSLAEPAECLTGDDGLPRFYAQSIHGEVAVHDTYITSIHSAPLCHCSTVSTHFAGAQNNAVTDGSRLKCECVFFRCQFKICSCVESRESLRAHRRIFG